MFTWISSRAGLVLAGALALAGCDEFPELSSAPSGAQANVAAAPVRAARSFAVEQAELVPGKVVVRGPRGYCLDKRSIRKGAGGGFALVAPCAALGGAADGLGLEPVLMTVQVQSQGLARKTASAAGLSAAFAEDGPIKSESGDGMSFVQLAKGGDAVVPGGEPKHWRAALNVNGQLIGLAVYSEKGGAAAGRKGKLLLAQFAEAILQNSPVQSALEE